MTDPSKTTYGERSPRAPRELDVFAFLIGTWDGTGRTRLPDGKVAEYPVAWIGRYILDGMAIADEAHGPYPDGTPFLGITSPPVRPEPEDVGHRVSERLRVVHEATGS